MATPEESEGVVENPQVIAVIGAGYVGTPTAVLLAHFGHEVRLAERDATRREALRASRSPMIEEGMDDILRSTQLSGRLRILEDAGEAVRGARFVFLCVATPLGPDGHADLTEIDEAAAQIAGHLEDAAVVVNKSTVPVGSAQRVATIIARDGVRVVSNPEFLREGHALRDSFGPDRTVVGGADRDAAKLVAALFAPTGAPAVVTDAPTAELTKYAANAFLATKISFINSIAELCETLGADIEHLVHGLGLDPRITSLFLRPGPGWGGPCLPKDVAALLALSSDAGVDLPVVRGAVIANEQTIRHITNTIASLAGGSLMGARLGVWGLTFKAGTGDRRDSPALTVASALVAGGANVNAFDPTVPAGSTDADLAGLVACESALAAARGCDVVVVLTEWPAFAALDLTEVAAAMSTPVIYDTRGIIDERAARDAGLSLVRLGRS